MCDRHFIIKTFPDDIYNAVGQIIKSAQEWEQEYKKLSIMLKVPVKNINDSSLNKLNNALKKYDLISEIDYKKLKEVIKIRNYINHEFYLTDFQNSADCYDKYIGKLEEILNLAQLLIFEATDFVDNRIDKLQNNSIMRPTVFD